MWLHLIQTVFNITGDSTYIYIYMCLLKQWCTFTYQEGLRQKCQGSVWSGGLLQIKRGHCYIESTTPVSLSCTISYHLRTHHSQYGESYILHN